MSCTLLRGQIIIGVKNTLVGVKNTLVGSKILYRGVNSTFLTWLIFSQKDVSQNFRAKMRYANLHECLEKIACNFSAELRYFKPNFKKYLKIFKRKKWL